MENLLWSFKRVKPFLRYLMIEYVMWVSYRPNSFLLGLEGFYGSSSPVGSFYLFKTFGRSYIYFRKGSIVSRYSIDFYNWEILHIFSIYKRPVQREGLL